MNWTPLNKQSENDKLGAELSVRIHCPVRYLEHSFQKPIFECKCEIPFPAYAVEGAMKSGNWSAVIKQHEEGVK